MSQTRIYELTDPDLPESLHHVRRIFLRPTFGQKPELVRLSGHQKARLAAEKIRQQIKEKQHVKEQLTLEVRP